MKHEIIVQKLLGCTDKILTYCAGMDYDAFSKNTMLTEACVFNLGQMGELVNHLEKDFTDAHPDIPWRYLYGLRNRIVHDYEGVNLQLIWEIIHDDLPRLRDQLQRI